MFQDAKLFNRDIGMWKVSGAIWYTAYTAYPNTNYACDPGYNTSNQWNIGVYRMFYGATKFNQDLSRWCVSTYPPNSLCPVGTYANYWVNNGGFSTSSALTSAHTPKRGTCPT